jgi:V/A-type H+-transporting ATPase subunit I
MSIVSLKKITLYGTLNEKPEMLDTLQHLGCVHIIPLSIQEDLLDKSEGASKIQEAFKYLNSCPNKLKPIKNSDRFDPVLIEKQILQNKHQVEQLQDEKDAVKEKIKELGPWGSFAIPPPEEIAGLKFWFYKVPYYEIKKLNFQTLLVKEVQRDNQFSYIVVVAENEPDFLESMQVKLPKEPLDWLKSRLEQIEVTLEDLQLEKVHLTRWLGLFEKNLFKLEDEALLSRVHHQTHDCHPLFAVQGWIPSEDAEKVSDYAKKNGLALKIEEPGAGGQPPTLLSNNEALKGGEDLLSFYMTPSYWLWDPSSTVFFSFAIFFAMIFSDAGYAIILGAILTFFWKHLGKTLSGRRFRNVLIALTVFSFIWGVLAGSYFGVAPSAQSFLSYLKIIDMNNYAAMMMLAIMVGVAHIVIANIAQGWSKRRSLTAIANFGWAAALIGAVTAFLGFKYPLAAAPAKTIGFILIGAGLGAVVLFTSIEKPFWKRLLSGLMGLTRITGMFGDVLSYLRLFALGLASASLAGVFNDLAKQIYHEMSGFKIILALMILLVGHTINFGLSLMSGFIHGLRLNFIEFFNWGLPEEGAPFKAFSKKEMSKWNR